MSLRMEPVTTDLRNRANEIEAQGEDQRWRSHLARTVPLLREAADAIDSLIAERDALDRQNMILFDSHDEEYRKYEARLAAAERVVEAARLSVATRDEWSEAILHSSDEAQARAYALDGGLGDCNEAMRAAILALDRRTQMTCESPANRSRKRMSATDTLRERLIRLLLPVRTDHAEATEEASE